MQYLADVLAAHAARLPRQVAMRILRAGRYGEWTYADVWERARRAAGRLQELGVRPGDRVALYGENSPEWILSCLGIYLAGAAAVPLDVQYTERELRTLLAFARPRVLLCGDSCRDAAQAVHPDTPVRDLISLDGDGALFAAAPSGALHRPDPGELMTLIFTSGTTGDPKGVRLSVGNILSNVAALTEMNLIQPDDTVLVLLPLHHVYALNMTVLVPLVTGASITLCASLAGPDILRAMRDTQVTIMPGVPRLFEALDRTIFDKVAQAAPFKRGLFHVLKHLSHGIRRRTGWNPGKLFFGAVHKSFGPRFRFFVSGGAKLDPEIPERLADLGLRIVEAYGLTETSPAVSFNIPGASVPGLTIQRTFPCVALPAAVAVGIG